jgi:hypothetical protein
MFDKEEVKELMDSHKNSTLSDWEVELEDEQSEEHDRWFPT